MPLLKGRCCCGAIRYEAGGTPDFRTNCHCSICRRASGAPFVTWFTVPASDFRVVAGTPAHFASSSHGVRSFCGACGTPLTFQSSKRPGDIDVTTCSLDDPECLPPEDHTRTSAKLSWVALCDGLPVHAEGRPG